MDNIYIVAGGAGFIGSHMCEYLLNKQYRVACVDNLYTGSLGNINHLLKSPNFTFYELDICNPTIIETFRNFSIGYIFNFACPASPIHYQKDPIFTIRTCVCGLLNLLEIAKEKRCPILQASTSEVYGEARVHPQDENYYGNVNPVGLRSCYDEGKRCAESILMNYHRQQDAPVKIVRIFNTYGPRMQINDGRVIPNFINQALNNQDLTIYGEGYQTRSFQYISDLIDALAAIIQTSDDVTGPVNVGNPEETPIIDLANIIIGMTSATSGIVYKEKLENDPVKRKPDISFACSFLPDWHPKVSIKEGLARTIKYYNHGTI